MAELDQYLFANKAGLILKKEFDLSMAQTIDGSYIKKPRSLSKVENAKRTLLPKVKRASESVEYEL